MGNPKPHLVWYCSVRGPTAPSMLSCVPEHQKIHEPSEPSPTTARCAAHTLSRRTGLVVRYVHLNSAKICVRRPGVVAGKPPFGGVMDVAAL